MGVSIGFFLGASMETRILCLVLLQILNVVFAQRHRRKSVLDDGDIWYKDNGSQTKNMRRTNSREIVRALFKGGTLASSYLNYSQKINN